MHQSQRRLPLIQTLALPQTPLCVHLYIPTRVLTKPSQASFHFLDCMQSYVYNLILLTERELVKHPEFAPHMMLMNRSVKSRTALLLRTEMSILRVEYMRPLFPDVIAASPVAHFLKIGCQMRDIDIIFPLIPCELLWVKWSE